MTVRYDSRQDFATKMARIETITLKDNLAWKYANFRSEYNDNDLSFRKHLHAAMGYKRSTVEDALY